MLLRRLKQAFGMPELTLTTIYANPSIPELTTAVSDLWKNQQASRMSLDQSRMELRNNIVKEYKDKLDRIDVFPVQRERSHRYGVLLTGSTGSLGAHLLQDLLANPSVSHVYCLNRSSNSSVVQHERNIVYGLPSDFVTTNTSRVTYLTVDVSQIRFSLELDVFDQLLETVGLVIHNAWPVNFNMSLESFRPQLDGLVNLIDFVANTKSSARLFFISSVGPILSYHSASHITPEAVIDLASLPLSNGYSESKAISETLLEHATKRLDMDMSIARVGQVAGAVSHAGLWSKSEWFPSLMMSSLHVGAMPDDLGPTLSNIDWVPIDLLASILVELAQLEREGFVSNRESPPTAEVTRRARVFYPHSPRPATWTATQATALDELARLYPDKPIETVSLHTWIIKVKKDAESIVGNSRIGHDELEAYLKTNPAAKLLDFYESLLSGAKGGAEANAIETKETAKCSPKLRALEGIKDAWVRKWTKEWMSPHGA